MPICTATNVTVFTDISASAGTIIDTGLIGIVQDRVNTICNNYFLTDMYVDTGVVFNATSGTITIGTDWSTFGFQAGDEIYIYNSYRNDGYKIIGSVTSTVLTLASGSTVVNELDGREIRIAVVKWPTSINYIASQMVKYDYDDRPGRTIGVSNETLGPYSVGYGTATFNPTPFGYPQELVDALSQFTFVRTA
jgi:hypothetical protein